MAKQQMLAWLNARCEDGLLVYTLGSSADGLRALEDLLSRQTLDGAVTGRLLELLTHQSLCDSQAHVLFLLTIISLACGLKLILCNAHP